MKNLAFVLFSLLSIALFSCNRCYDCQRKCGTCTNGFVIVAGCDGDSILDGASVDAWKAYFESQGYTCTYNNPPSEEVCGSEDKSTYTDKGYTCTSK
ncbi:MAG: hypothetical protein K1X82_13815 [Bacteroidia bacterium]|nr:hypothetical protein [Bacteroidia bacterium]